MTAGLCLIPAGRQVSNKQVRQLAVSITRAREMRAHTEHTHTCAYRKTGEIPVFFFALLNQNSRNIKIESTRWSMNGTSVLTKRHDSGWYRYYPSMAGGSRPVKSIQVRRHGLCHENTKLLCPFLR